MECITYERDITPRTAPEEIPFFEVEKVETRPAPGGARVKVTFQSGVRLDFQLQPGQSCDLVKSLAHILAGWREKEEPPVPKEKI